MPRKFDKNNNVDESKNVAATVKATGALGGHAGHVITIHADYGAYCETDGVTINTDSVVMGSKDAQIGK